MSDYTAKWHERCLQLTRWWRSESLSPGGRFSLSVGLPRINVGLYVAIAKDGTSVRYVGKVRRPERFNALAMRVEEHHGAREMSEWGDDIWVIPLLEVISEADVLDAEAALIDVLDPPENKTHRRALARGGWVTRELHRRTPRSP